MKVTITATATFSFEVDLPPGTPLDDLDEEVELATWSAFASFHFRDADADSMPSPPLVLVDKVIPS